MSRDVSGREFEEFERPSGDSGVRPVDGERDHPRREHRQAFSDSRERAPQRGTEPGRSETHFRDGRAVLHDLDRDYELTESEIRTIVELGKFRAIATQNLGEHAYGKNQERANREVRKLVRQDLVGKGIFEGPEANPRELLTLTKRGHRLLRRNRLAPEGQATYSGFVKPREANHDADLYLVYQKEAERIEAQGGRDLRVILDYELKRRLNRDFAKLGAAAREEIAELHGLEVVRDKIPVPDLRIEYETRDGEMARVDLELVTEHYRGRHVAEKVRAGFSLYTPHGEADRLRRVLDERELTAEILSL